MNVREVLQKMSGPDRIIIMEESGKELFKGFQGMLQTIKNGTIDFKSKNVDMSAEVVKIGLLIEIYKREKRESILASTDGYVPIPDMITNISYGDLEQCIYTKIVTKK